MYAVDKNVMYEMYKIHEFHKMSVQIPMYFKKIDSEV